MEDAAKPRTGISPQQKKKLQVLPFADAPNIVRAHQKDSYFESVLRSKIQETLQVFTGQRFIHTHPDELTILAKALYLSLTTLVGSRTLGEEYTDLIYVSRDGRRIPKLLQRIGFILSYAIVPYFITKWLNKRFAVDASDEDDNEKTKKTWRDRLAKVSYPKVLDSLMNVHLALFYLKGSYYNLSKRVFGLRYAFGHQIDKRNEVSNGGYELLGGIILAQFLFRTSSRINEVFFQKDDDEDELLNKSLTLDLAKGKIDGLPPTFIETDDIDLSNPKLLQYIPENSRKCMLCLSYMVNPSCAPCGHLFCWKCICEWSREHPECPLCRQNLTEQSLLPLH